MAFFDCVTGGGSAQSEYVIGAGANSAVQCLANYHIPLDALANYDSVVMTKIAGSGSVSRGQLFFTDASLNVLSANDIQANQTYSLSALMPANTAYVRIGVVANSASGFNGVSVKFTFS